MRIRMLCWTCMKPAMDLLIDAQRRGDPRSKEEERATMQAAHKEVDIIVSDDQVHRATCPEGHQLAWVISNPRHELLFERGALAMVDGYYREAVANFAAALERFYEFHTRVVVWKRGIDAAQLDAAWKDVAAQSERQLGAFLYTALMHYGTSVRMIAKKQIEFRNSVIHKGTFPSYDEAVAFGEAVRAFICTYLKALETSGADPYTFQHNVLIAPICRENSAVSQVCATLLSLAEVHNAEYGARTLEEGLVEVRRYRKDLYPRVPE